MDARLDPAKYAGLSEGFYEVGSGPGSDEGAFIDWLTIADRNKAVVDDVSRIRRHALVPSNIPIYGYVYDVTTGALLEVPGAQEAGAVR
jgi:carbonic anhydrase